MNNNNNTGVNINITNLHESELYYSDNIVDDLYYHLQDHNILNKLTQQDIDALKQLCLFIRKGCYIQLINLTNNK